MNNKEYTQWLCEKACTQFLQGELNFIELKELIDEAIGDYRLIEDLKD